MKKDFLSTAEAAKILGISRIAVFKQIKAGKIKAQKVGRNFIIEKKEFPFLLGKSLGEAKKGEIERAVTKAIREYGETLKLLGSE